MLKSVLLALLVLAVPCSAAIPEDDLPSSRSVPRVRPGDSRAAALLLGGLSRSETMRLLVNELETLNVIVYVEMQPGLNRQLGGRLAWVTAVKNFRYVRVSINPDLSAESAMSVLAHELQHAMEVAHAPSIVDEASLEAYYRKNGISTRVHTSGWDTQKARDMGDMVRREIAGTASRGMDSVTSFHPNEWDTVYRRARDRFTSR